ncbi:MAG: Fic family protein [Propionibacteriaceae bacterium]|jgi:Fic family protein|nr:Fic family protein [Propionibacteriaceae bacterium]
MAEAAGRAPEVPVEPVAFVDSVLSDDEADRILGYGRAPHVRRYRSATVPPLADAAVPLPAGDLAGEVEDATAALVRLDGFMEGSAGGSGEGVAPMAAVLLRSESASSSQIEQLTVGSKQLALAQLGVRASANAVLVARNADAMRRAIELAGRLDVASILDVHTALMRDRIATAGRLRDGPVWIGPGGSTPATADFVPPTADRVPASMDDLCRFARRDDLPVLAQAAITHAQFESIHPFFDGNGRTGRALVQSMLRGKHVTRRVPVPVSAGLLADVPAYFAALTAYRSGDAAPIIRQFARASFIAAAEARRVVGELTDLQTAWRDRLRLRSSSAAYRALPVIASQPAVDGAYIRTRLGVSGVTAREALARLQDAGILTTVSAGRRNRVWIAPEAIAIMDSLAQRIPRRA